MSSNLLQLPSDRLAPLAAHNKYQDVDRLYDPLRHSFDPLQPHVVSGEATLRSHVSHHQMHLTQQQRNKLVTIGASTQKESTLIPSQDRLVPTHDLSLIAGTAGHLVAINSVEKVGAPLTPQQMHQRVQNRHADEVIVYQIGDLKPAIVQPPVPQPINQPPIIIEQPLGVNQYRMPSLKEFAPRPVKPYRYNLYSMIDEPVNRMMETPGCNIFGVCTRCAPNQIIATRNQVRNNWLR